MFRSLGSQEERDEEAIKQSEERDDFDTTVQCPHHDLPLQIQTEQREIKGETPDKNTTVFVRFAVCNCKVPNNTHMNARVWEQIPSN